MDAWGAFVRVFERLRLALVRFLGRLLHRPPSVWGHDAVLLQPSEEPPADWVERVRRGAPGLLEPSVREQARRRVAASRPPVSATPASHAAAALVPDPHEEPLLPEPVVAVRSEQRATGPVPHREAHGPVGGEPLPRTVRRRAVITEFPREQSDPSPAYEAERPEPDEVALGEAPVVREPAPHSPDRPVPARREQRAQQQQQDALRHEWSVRASDPRAVTDEAPQRPVPAHSAMVWHAHGRADVEAADGAHPWPDLPAPVQAPPTGIEPALRAWAREQRLDEEQSRL